MFVRYRDQPLDLAEMLNLNLHAEFHRVFLPGELPIELVERIAEADVQNKTKIRKKLPTNCGVDSWMEYL